MNYHYMRVLLGSAAGAILLPVSAFAGILYVAPPPVGSDANSGASVDSPLATINRAAQTSGVSQVVIRGGIYRETVTPGNGTTFSAYNGEAVTISGADVVTGWSAYTGSGAGGTGGNGGGKVYTSSNMTWTLNGGKDDQVFVDGLMMNLARHPNNPRFELVTAPKLTVDSAVVSAIVSGNQTAVVSDASLTDSYTGAIFHQLGSGADNLTYGMGDTHAVTASSAGSLTISITNPTTSTKYLPAAKSLYFLDGLGKLLDSGGEWFRQSTGELLLWTPAGDPPASHVVEAKRRDYGFNLAGRSNVTIAGIRLFACTIFTDITSQNNTLTGIDIVYPSHFGRVTSVYEDGVATLDINGSPEAGSGVYLTGKNNIFQNSSVAYAAGAGVAVGGRNNKVLNSLIHDVAYMGTDGAGVTAGQSEEVITSDKFCAGAEIAGNTIYNSSRALIQMRGLYAGNVHNNHLWHGMLNTYDYGAIYALNHDHWGTGSRFNGLGGGFSRISRNRIHSTPPDGAKAAIGIYLDNDSYDYVVDHNVLWGATCSIMMTATTLDPVNDVEARLEIDPAVNEGMNFSGNMTMAILIKPGNSTSTLPRNIIRHGPQGNSEVFFRLNNGYYELGSSTNNGTSKVTNMARYAFPAADLDSWVHYAGVYNGTQWLLYRNGVQVASQAASFGAVALSTSTLDRIWILSGMLDWDEDPFDDYMDEFRLYQGALTAAQVLALSQGTAPAVTLPTALQMHLSFEGYTGNRTVSDASGTRNTAANTNLKYGRTSYKNVLIESAARTGTTDNHALRCPPSAAWRGMHIYNNTVQDGIGYGSEVTARTNSIDPQSAFLNNICLQNSNHIWFTAAAGGSATPRVFRTNPSLKNSNNITTYGTTGDPGWVAIGNVGLVSQTNRDYRLTGTSATKDKGIPITLNVPDTTLALVNGAYPTKTLQITAGGDAAPDLGAYEGGDWVAGAAALASGSLPNGWSRQDIGAADPVLSPAGYTAFIGNNYYVTGGGTGIGGALDGFHFASTSLVGDGEISAVLLQQEASNQSIEASAGLMLRASSASNASFVGIALNQSGISFASRGGTAAAAPVASFFSPGNGTPAAPNTTHTLVANASFDGGTISFVTFRVNGAYLLKGQQASAPYYVPWTPTAAGNYTLTAQATSSTGATSNIASTTVKVVAGTTTPTVAITSPAAGDMFQSGTAITLAAQGDVVTGAVAKIVFRYSWNGGAATYIATAAASPYTLTWTPPGPGSYTVSAQIFDSSTPAALTQYAVSVPITVIDPTAGLRPPIHLKLSRAGDVFTGSYSTDGASWVAAGSYTLTGMPDPALAGMAVSTHDSLLLTTAIFGSVKINATTSPLLRTGLDEWLGQKYPNTADTSSYISFTPAGEEMPNLLRYALGVDPLAAAQASDWPQCSISGPDASGKTYLTLGLRKRTSGTSGVTYIVEESTDLATWTPVNMAANQIGSQSLSGGLSQITVRSSQATQSAPKLFMRLKVDANP